MIRRRPRIGVRATRDVWDGDDAIDAVHESFRILAQGVGPDGTQLADERESLLWGFVMRVNPLERMTLARDLLFVDGRREAEIAWALAREEASGSPRRSCCSPGGRSN